MTWRQIHAVGAGLLAAALLMLLPAVALRAIEHGPTTPAWWDLILASGFVACGVGLVASFVRRHDPQRPAGLLAVVTAVAIATFPFVATAPLDPGEAPWVALLAPVAAAALGVALRWLPALCCGVALAVVLTVAHMSGSWPTATYELITQAVYVVICAAASATGMEALRSQAKAVDFAEERAIVAAAQAGLLAAQQQETARWDAFIHDEVLAVLEAARAGHVAPTDLTVLASQALAAMNRSPGSGRYTVGEIRDRLSRIAGVPVDAGDSSRVEPMPGDVVEAIEAAIAEAARNVRRHTPAGTAMTVTMDCAGDALIVEVRDGGNGFDPARVSRTCMGIGVSIVGRMRAVGGDAVVLSAPGRPTAVRIRWPAES